MLRFPFVALIALTGSMAIAQDNFPEVPFGFPESRALLAKLRAEGLSVEDKTSHALNMAVLKEEAVEFRAAVTALGRRVGMLEHELGMMELLPSGSPALRLAREGFDSRLQHLRDLKREGLLRDLKLVVEDAYYQGWFNLREYLSDIDDVSKRIDRPRASRRVDGTGRQLKPLGWMSNDDLPDSIDNHWFYELLREAGVRTPWYSGRPRGSEWFDKYLAVVATPSGDWRRAAHGYLAARELKGHGTISQEHTWMRLIVRAAWLEPDGKMPQFVDVAKNHWAIGAVRGMREQGVLVGDGKGAFKGGG